jgi:hypothetical protein
MKVRSVHKIEPFFTIAFAYEYGAYISGNVEKKLYEVMEVLAEEASEIIAQESKKSGKPVSRRVIPRVMEQVAHEIVKEICRRHKVDNYPVSVLIYEGKEGGHIHIVRDGIDFVSVLRSFFGNECERMILANLKYYYKLSVI